MEMTETRPGALPADVDGSGEQRYRGGEALLEDVHYSYDGETPALDGITLNVRRGEFVAVIGANGSGKSTLAKHVNALYVPDSGRVVVEDIDTSEPGVAYTVRSKVGMVFQNPDNQAVTTIVADDVAFGPENLGLERDEIERRVDAALHSVGMQELSGDEIPHLSGGQKQRVSIAGILAMEPDILVLDEPGAMLDPRGRRGIRRVTRQLAEHGMTVILITHFMEEAIRADRVVVVADGRVVLDGRPEDVFTQGDRLRELRLDVPAIVGLTETLRLGGLDIADVLDEDELEVELCRLFSNR